MTDSEAAAVAAMVRAQLEAFAAEMERKNAAEHPHFRAAGSAESSDPVKKILDALQSYVRRATAPLSARVKVLEETPPLTYEGIFESGREYRVGQFVTYGGSMWACRAATSTQRPGDGSPAWQLAVKSGRDGRDAAR